MTKEDGGPAFPDPGRAQSEKQREKLPYQGMSIRDWFAGMALQGMLSDSGEEQITSSEYAAVSYKLADAMLKERNK